MARKTKNNEIVLSEEEAKALYEAAQSMNLTIEELKEQLWSLQSGMSEIELPPDPSGDIAGWASSWTK